MSRKLISNNTFLILFSIILFLIQLYNVKFGVDVTEQSFWVAEPFLITNGSIPIYDNWNQTPLSSVLISPIVKGYVGFNNTTEGIMYFFCVIATVFRYICCMISYFFMKKCTNKNISFIFCSFLFICMIGDKWLNYTTISVYLLLVI